MAPLTLFNEAPKRKSVAPLALKNAYLWLHWPSLIRGTRPFFNICRRDIWYFCVTILWNFCEVLLVARGGYIVFLAYDNGMGPR